MAAPPDDKSSRRHPRGMGRNPGGSLLSTIGNSFLLARRLKDELSAGESYKRIRADWDSQEFDREALGHGRLAERGDLESRDLLGSSGIPIGFFEGEPILYPRGASGLIYGPPGIGKDTSLIAHLLGHVFDRSVFCIDVAGESRAMAGTHRAKQQDRELIAIAPYRDSSASFNPFASLITLAEAGKPLALNPYEVAKGLVPPSKETNEGAWVRRGAINMVAELIRLDVLTHGPKSNPGNIFDQLNGGQVSLVSKFTAMKHSGDPVLEHAGERFLDRIEYNMREFGFVVDEAAEFLMIYQDGSPLRAAVRTSDITPAELKRDPRTVFFEIPGDQMYVARQYVAAVLNSFIEGVAMAEAGQTRTLFLANEFTQIGQIPSLRKALRLYRKYGVQFMLYAQSRAAIEEIYGAEGRRDIEENCEFMQILATEDPELIKAISDWSGTQTVAIREASLSGGSTPSVNEQIKLSTRPVLQGENIRSLEIDEQIIKFQNMPLILAERRYWKKDPYLSEVLEEPLDGIQGIVR